MKSTALLTTSIGNYQKRSGKVRDIYDLSDRLLMVATDRISAYDVVMANGIPDKGRVLTQISLFWFELFLDMVANHVISVEMDQLPEDCRAGNKGRNIGQKVEHSEYFGPGQLLEEKHSEKERNRQLEWDCPERVKNSHPEARP